MWQEVPAWSWTWLWLRADGFMKATLFLLLIMLLHACFVLVERIRRFMHATKQLAALDPAAIAGTGRRSGVFANLISTGLGAFQSAPSSCSTFGASEYARRAMVRRRSLAHAEMSMGVNTIATIAAIAPFVGLAGTVVGLLGMLKAGTGSRMSWLVHYANSIAVSLVPTVFGIFVGVVALWFYNHLVRRMEIFDVQTQKAASLVVRHLEAQPASRQADDATAGPMSTPLFGGSPAEWEARFDAHSVLLASVGLVWLYVAATIVWACFWHFMYR
jgi:biopolymer transport protein ExbB/TolQ